MNNTAYLSSLKNIVKKLLISFGFAFAFVFLVLSVNQILLLAGFFRENQPGVSQGILLFLYCLPSVVTMAVPFAVCIGFVYGLIKLNFMEALLKNKKNVLPVVLLGLILSIITFIFSDFVMTKSIQNFRKLYWSISAVEEIPAETPLEMTLSQLLGKMNQVNENDKETNRYMLELNKKFAILFASLFFACFALSLSAVLGKHLKTALCVSFFSCIAYWALVMYGQIFSVRSGTYGALAMWLPNMVFLCIAVILWFVKNKGTRESLRFLNDANRQSRC